MGWSIRRGDQVLSNGLRIVADGERLAMLDFDATGDLSFTLTVEEMYQERARYKELCALARQLQLSGPGCRDACLAACKERDGLGKILIEAGFRDEVIPKCLGV